MLISQAKLVERKLRKKASRWRRQLFEAVGSDRYSKPARGSYQDALERYLPKTGFFVEAGANDGFSESNTYHLEKFKGWTGVLVEAIPELYRACVRERSQSKVFNYALVNPEYPQATMTLTYSHLMSFAKGSLGTEEYEQARVQKAQQYWDFQSYEVEVPTRTLASILDAVGQPQIDFLSLDVEGFEIEVLQGLDLNRYQPQYLLIECWNPAAKQRVEALIGKQYQFVRKFAKWDYLYQLK